MRRRTIRKTAHMINGIDLTGAGSPALTIGHQHCDVVFSKIHKILSLYVYNLFKIQTFFETIAVACLTNLFTLTRQASLAA